MDLRLVTPASTAGSRSWRTVVARSPALSFVGMGGGGVRGGSADDDADAEDAPSDDDDDDEGNGTTNSEIGNVASENVAPFSMLATLAKKGCVPSVVGEGVQVSKCATDVCVCAAAAQIEISQSRNGFHMHDDV